MDASPRGSRRLGASGMFWLAYTISEWVIRLVMLPVVARRRKPDAAMAWLLLIFFCPGPG